MIPVGIDVDPALREVAQRVWTRLQEESADNWPESDPFTQALRAAFVLGGLRGVAIGAQEMEPGEDL